MKNPIITADEIRDYAETTREFNRLKKLRDELSAGLKARIQAATPQDNSDGLMLALEERSVATHSASDILLAIVDRLPQRLKQYVAELQTVRETQYALKIVVVAQQPQQQTMKAGKS